jgi:hypothetical protein
MRASQAGYILLPEKTMPPAVKVLPDGASPGVAVFRSSNAGPFKRRSLFAVAFPLGVDGFRHLTQTPPIA